MTLNMTYDVSAGFRLSIGVDTSAIIHQLVHVLDYHPIIITRPVQYSWVQPAGLLANKVIRSETTCDMTPKYHRPR